LLHILNIINPYLNCSEISNHALFGCTENTGLQQLLAGGPYTLQKTLVCSNASDMTRQLGHPTNERDMSVDIYHQQIQHER
jgi:hypothetical protein